jgi:anaerobic dimethyl sulfoxide reductase subunit C (anchor subunit)
VFLPEELKMLRKEWSLISNSLLVQLAVGMFVFNAIYRLLLPEIALQITWPGMALAGPVIALGMLTSFFHLGNPFRAHRAVKNIGSSWLSREVIFTVAFLVFWLLFFILEKSGSGSQVVIWLAILMGLLSVVSMAGIYYVTQRPGWDGINSYFSFLSSLVVFGSITILLAVALNGDGSSTITGNLLTVTTWLLPGVMLLRLVQQLVVFIRMKPTKEERNMDSLVSASSNDFFQQYKSLTILGLVFSILGTALVLYAYGTETIRSGFVVAAAVLIIIGELLGRSGFYSLAAGETH